MSKTGHRKFGVPVNVILQKALSTPMPACTYSHTSTYITPSRADCCNKAFEWASISLNGGDRSLMESTRSKECSPFLCPRVWLMEKRQKVSISAPAESCTWCPLCLLLLLPKIRDLCIITGRETSHKRSKFFGSGANQSLASNVCYGDASVILTQPLKLLVKSNTYT